MIIEPIFENNYYPNGKRVDYTVYSKDAEKITTYNYV
jgi:hypothetical protein